MPPGSALLHEEANRRTTRADGTAAVRGVGTGAANIAAIIAAIIATSTARAPTSAAQVGTAATGNVPTNTGTGTGTGTATAGGDTVAGATAHRGRHR
jgi:hypothetical protein